MMHDLLIPGMQNREAADPSAEAFGIGGHFQKGLRYGTKQNPINDAWILQRQRRQFVRQSKYHVAIRNGQDLPFTVGKPLVARPAVAFGAVPVAA